jgi:hypothetical protein
MLPVHAAITHDPPEHAGVAFGSEHAVAQAPQFATDVRVSTSQPFAAFASQLPKPALQGPSAQTPDAHVAIAFANAHALPQAPQFAIEVWMLVSHPLAVFPSQSARPGEHVLRWQTPIVHTADAPGKLHTVPHAPQLATLVARFTSQPSLAM